MYIVVILVEMSAIYMCICNNVDLEMFVIHVHVGRNVSYMYM